MRAAGYFRVSDEDQVDGYSLDAQRRAFQEYCKGRGWEVAVTYNEEGRSAWGESVAKRPAYRQMLEDAQTGKFDVVMTHTLDRLSRNLRVMLDTFHLFSQHNVTYVSITQDINYTTPEGQLFMTMLGAFAQYFSDALSGHTKKGMRERARQGMFNGEPPFGYERCDAECFGIDETHTGCHIDPAKMPIIVELFQRYAAGAESMATLADWINEQGFRTKGKRPLEIFGEIVETDGRRFTNYSVRDILKNRFYIGKVRHKDEWFEGRHQPIVDQELFDAVQERVKKNRSRKSCSSGQKSENPHLLAGLLKDQESGLVLWSQTQGRGSGTFYKLPDKGVDCQSEHKGAAFVGHVFDDQANLLFSKFQLREDWAEWILERCRRGSDAAVALKRREDIEGKVERARNLYIEGEISREKFRKIKADAEALLVNVYVPEFDDAIEAAKILSDFPALWDSSSVARRNRFLKTMLNVIYVDLDTRRLVGLVPKEPFLMPILAMSEREDVAVLLGKVETGEGRTPRPKGPLARYATSLSGGFGLASGSLHRPSFSEASRLSL